MQLLPDSVELLDAGPQDRASWQQRLREAAAQEVRDLAFEHRDEDCGNAHSDCLRAAPRRISWVVGSRKRSDHGTEREVDDGKGDDQRSHRPAPEEWRRDLASSMRRLNEQLGHDNWRDFSTHMQQVGQHLARGLTQEALYQASRALDRAHEQHVSKIERKLRRQEERAAVKAARRRERYESRMRETSTFEGYVRLAAAAVFVTLVFAMPHLWWMIFIAFPFALSGARIVGYHQRSRVSLPEKSSVPSVARVADDTVDPLATRIDETCRKLLAALKDAPATVRDFLSNPEQTVEALRKSWHDLLKRENTLRAFANPTERVRLEGERAVLEARVAAEADDVARTRLQGALAALDQQRAQHTEVLKSANRLEAERTRLGYTLDGLYAQVMRVRTSEISDDAAQAGLRQSLDQLRDEMGALADAVTSVNESTTAMTAAPADVSDIRAGPQRVRG